MADPLIIEDDLGLFLTAWYRVALAARPEAYCENVVVDAKEPAGAFPDRLLVITDGGGAETSFLTSEHTVNLSILAGTKLAPQDANDLARMARALRSQIPAVGFAVTLGGRPYRNPVTAVISSTGPFDVPEQQDRARRLVSVTFAVSGEAL